MSLLRAIKISDGEYILTDAATAVIQDLYEVWRDLNDVSFGKYLATSITDMGLTARTSDSTEGNDKESMYNVLELGSQDTEWVVFLTEKGICSADETGNMPCDYGTTCCKCGAPWIQEDYEEWLVARAEAREGTL